MKDFSTLKLISAKKGIKRIILNDPKSYNSLSLKTINDLIYLFKIGVLNLQRSNRQI